MPLHYAIKEWYEAIDSQLGLHLMSVGALDASK